LKIVKSPYLNEKLLDFDEIWFTTTDLELDDSHVINCDFKIQNGGRGRYIENCFWPYFSS